MSTIKEDPSLLLLDAMLYSREGLDPSQAIVDQERRGQLSMIVHTKLPRKWHAMSELTEEDLVEQYQSIGIKVVKDATDDLFFDAELPDGWKIESDGGPYWSNLVDDKGRPRARIFYKAAIYDRDAFISFITRYSIAVVPTSDSDDYEVRKVSPLVGQVKDCGKVIYTTDPIDFMKKFGIKKAEDTSHRYWVALADAKYDLRNQLAEYMAKHYPKYEDVNAYWES